MLKTGPTNYFVQMASNKEFEADRWGDVRHDLGVIRIHEDTHDKLALITLLHEAMHALGFVFGLQLEEQAIESWAPMIIMFLEDNGVDLSPLQNVVQEAKYANRTGRTGTNG